MKKKSKTLPQIAALPVDRRGGAPRVMLVTSRETGRWVIPKGWPKKSLPARKVAALEAFEEAGLKGRVARRPIGRYTYDKRLASGDVARCRVEVYVMAVEDQLDDWPERAERERRWMAPEEAAPLVDEPELGALLRKIAETSELP